MMRASILARRAHQQTGKLLRPMAFKPTSMVLTPASTGAGVQMWEIPAHQQTEHLAKPASMVLRHTSMGAGVEMWELSE